MYIQTQKSLGSDLGIVFGAGNAIAFLLGIFTTYWLVTRKDQKERKKSRKQLGTLGEQKLLEAPKSKWHEDVFDPGRTSRRLKKEEFKEVKKLRKQLISPSYSKREEARIKLFKKGLDID